MSDPSVDPRARLRHDLRTPLHQIIGYAELLEDEVRDAGQEKYLADLDKIRDAARKALEFVDQAVPPTSSPAASRWSVSAAQVPYRLPNTSAHSRNSSRWILASKSALSTNR